MSLNRNAEITVLSLSGGGFRAALYHAGVLRAMYEAGIFNGEEYGKKIICAVSGGAISTVLWDIYLKTDVSFRKKNIYWPELQLLWLTKNSPKILGRYYWGALENSLSRYLPKYTKKILGSKLYNLADRPWYYYLTIWWEQCMKYLSCDEICKGNEMIIPFIEMLDYDCGNVLVWCDNKIFIPDNEFFKNRLRYKNLKKYPCDSVELGIFDTPKAIAIATAVPVYFKKWKINGYNLLDAGIVDNQGVLALNALISKIQTPHLTKGDNWIFSNAAGAFKVLEKCKPVEPWNYIEYTKKLSKADEFERYTTGQLAQNQFLHWLIRAISESYGINVKAIRIGNRPHSVNAGGPEKMWFQSNKFKTEHDIAIEMTSLSGMKNDDAFTIIAHGAQLASYAFMASPKERSKFKEKLLGFLQI